MTATAVVSVVIWGLVAFALWVCAVATDRLHDPDDRQHESNDTVPESTPDND